MTTVLPLPIWPYPPTPGMLDTVKRAKEALAARLQLDFKVQVVQAVPGTPSRVLSMGGRPTFVCDVLEVKPGDDIPSALEWVLDDGQPIERGFTKADYLRALIGAREITTERNQS